MGGTRCAICRHPGEDQCWQERQEGDAPEIRLGFQFSTQDFVLNSLGNNVGTFYLVQLLVAFRPDVHKDDDLTQCESIHTIPSQRWAGLWGVRTEHSGQQYAQG